VGNGGPARKSDGPVRNPYTLGFWVLLFKMDTAFANARTLAVLRLFRKKDSFQCTQFAHQLNCLLTAATNRESTLSHDKIYAPLGMCHDVKLPKTLLPNYSLPFSQVCYQYAKFLVAKTGELVRLATLENHLAGVPSWVPDLRQDVVDADDPLTQANIPRDGQGLIVEGLEIGVISRVWRAFEGGGLVTMEPKMAGYLDIILSLAASARRCSLEEVYDEAIHGLIGNLTFKTLDDLLASIDKWDPKVLDCLMRLKTALMKVKTVLVGLMSQARPKAILVKTNLVPMRPMG
jgi:hypothetical protein